MTLAKIKPHRQSLEHKRRHGLHHKHSQHYLKTYWPYLPIVTILTLGLFLSSWLGTVHQSVLGYATDVSVSELYKATNTQRADNSLPALSMSNALQTAAQNKANDMAARDYWSHNTPDGKTPWSFIISAGYNFQTAGENLAYGFESSDDTITGWMNSPEHRANILNSNYKDVGFGVINVPNYQNSGPETLVVAMYASPLAAATPVVAKVNSPSVPPSYKAPAPAPAVAAPSPTPVPSPPPVAAESKPPVPATSANSSLTTAKSPEPSTKNIARVQLVSSGAMINYYFIGLIGVVCFGFLLLRHSMAWHRRLVRGEKFMLNHPLFDILTASLLSAAIILGHTVGFIR